MLKYYLYKLTFESGATYIGQHTQRVENDKYITSSSYYKRHPEDKLLKREIFMEFSDKEDMDIFETICIMADKAENTKNVNGNLGGWMSPKFPGWNKGIPNTEAQKKKKSEKLKGKPGPWKGKSMKDETKQKISSSLKGRPSPTKGMKLSEEHKKAISEANKKVVHDAEWNKKVGDAQRGKKKSKESVEKMRQALLGKKLSEEHKQSISKAQCGSSYWNNGVICKVFKKGEEPGEGWVRGRLDKAWNKGKKLSEEQRQKMSESMKGRIPWNKGVKNDC